ncbi:5'-methylthioadenosine/adenosylhomocysteine nucleosidase [Buchnera aphidicola]|uniref:5'-methylthioadenosine/S-adenosylhomocysteine nucleosidase n=2 Tax=Buchnera aphidicola TaxID=9 RepID=MTNN_BUCA5|nr:5'-methylthioadenosine/adenosylhomocysteine nucleosidase [Buchnera aphidicola]B8D7B4.1 RecName: Full=5'-methylthioadenosine/S-adenosylhomocysteine nucleosidase; Short=MTA/SAH nucleosidase; Short=MTAN; AltName: Full=5'-deoxyadenosine nucleosidase; Short=DOA nucleosidase; Short=dAdo nucleosidase; AltName: Full=5'-methylthioadenosine nucleosidase; Short=MTA nucleosidase; AltName: Full=S-adenosylhomocysteine nucleosidase; Short=AdoHcy nucleosidase; Short=SAH nucleosidase; Short=SRH nucleosidase [Bu
MKIGIIGAINQETERLKKIIHFYIEKKINTYKIYIGKFKSHDVFLIKSGIGKVSASIATMILIDLYKPDTIINSGSAGSLQSFLKIGDIIIPKKTCYYDVDLTNFGYTRGQIPGYPKEFTVNEKICNFFKKNADKYQLKYIKGLILSGDTFVRENESIKILKKQFPSAIAVEMESSAIAQVCYKFNIPLIIIKSISDASDNNATVNFKENIDIVSYQLSKFVKIILENLIDM